MPEGLCYHSGVKVTGKLQTSTHPKQEVELIASELSVSFPQYVIYCDVLTLFDASEKASNYRVQL